MITLRRARELPPVNSHKNEADSTKADLGVTSLCRVLVVPTACGFAGGWHSRPYIDGGSSRSCLEGFAFLDRTSTKAHSDFSEQKKFEQEMRRLRRVRSLNDGARVLFARSLTMTPDERRETHERFLRSHGLFTHSERKAFGFK